MLGLRPSPFAHYVLVLFGLVRHLGFDGCLFLWTKALKMAHPENRAPNLLGSVASCEPGHATQPDSMGNDEIDLRIGQLPQPSSEFWNRRIEIRLELIAAAAVQAVATCTMCFKVLSTQAEALWGCSKWV
jgi:hypothetical protein